MRHFLISILLLVSGQIYSQPTYPSSSYGTIGDTILISSLITGLGSFDFESTGADYSWDFAALSVNSQNYTNFIAPKDGGYKLIWCGFHGYGLSCNTNFNSSFNLASIRTDSIGISGFQLRNVVDHYNKTTSTFEAKMIGGTIDIGGFPIPITIDYTDADTIFQFPLIYNQIDSSKGSYKIDLTSLMIDVVYSFNNKRINHVEGWGELITPYANFPSVLKVKTINIKNDTLTVGGNDLVFRDTLVNYRWFDPTYSIPVLNASGILVSGEPIITNVTYIDHQRCIEPQSLFSYAPFVPYFDSTSQSVDIEFRDFSLNSDSVEWDFGDGTISNLMNPIHTFHCPGVKNVKLKAFNTFCEPVAVDSITLPVVIFDTTSYFKNYASLAICDNDSVFLEGAYRSTPGVYYDTIPSFWGCDSVVISTLLVNPTYSIPKETTICQGDSVFLEGAYQTEPGEYVDILQTFLGCDSVIVTTLNVNQSYLIPLELNICQGDSVFLAGTYQTEPGEYKDSYQTILGCDSIVLTTLNVTTIDKTLSEDEGTLISNEPDGTFQWLDCNKSFQPIEGETNQTFTPLISGDFAVEIFKSGCIDTSSCRSITISGIIENSFDEMINIFPNPAKNQITIKMSKVHSDLTFSIYSLNGTLRYQKELSGKKQFSIDVSNLNKGLYIIYLYEKNKKELALQFKLIKN